MSNAKTLELRTLEDDELLGVVGGWGGGGDCHPRRCDSGCGDDCRDFSIEIDISLCFSL